MIDQESPSSLSPAPGTSTGSFWTTLPGILTALATLIAAVAGAWVSLQPPSDPSSPVRTEVSIADFVRKSVPEQAEYSVRDGALTFTLIIHEVKGKKGAVVFSAGTASGSPRYTVKNSEQVVIPVGGRDYTFSVQEINDREDNQDQAVISIRPK